MGHNSLRILPAAGVHCHCRVCSLRRRRAPRQVNSNAVLSGPRHLVQEIGAHSSTSLRQRLWIRAWYDWILMSLGLILIPNQGKNSWLWFVGTWTSDWVMHKHQTPCPEMCPRLLWLHSHVIRVKSQTRIETKNWWLWFVGTRYSKGLRLSYAQTSNPMSKIVSTMRLYLHVIRVSLETYSRQELMIVVCGCSIFEGLVTIQCTFINSLVQNCVNGW